MTEMREAPVSPTLLPEAEKPAYATPERPTRVRFLVLALLASAAVTAYLTRICLATASSTIQNEFQLSNGRMGEIMGAFFLGYLWFQVPSGLLGARFGGRKTLFGLGLLAALCAGWSGLAAGAGALWASRIGLGVAQAGLVPCASRSVLDWFPARNRGTASCVIASSMLLGGVAASALTPWLLRPLGWRGVFLAYAGVTLLWAVAYFAGFRDRPELHPAANAAEHALIHESAEAAPAKTAPPASLGERFRANVELLAAMAVSSSAWLLCGQALFRAFGAAFFFTWFPNYLEKAHHVRLQDTGVLAMLPLLSGVLGPLVGGPIVDLVLQRTGNRWLSRSGTAAAALVLCALCTFAATLVANPVTVVLILTVGNFCFGTGSPSTWAACMDVAGEHTQFISGLQNMAGNAGAYWCSTLIGSLFDWILKTHASWNVVLYVFVGIHLGGAVCWLCFNPNRSAVARVQPS